MSKARRLGGGSTFLALATLGLAACATGAIDGPGAVQGSSGGADAGSVGSGNDAGATTDSSGSLPSDSGAVIPPQGEVGGSTDSGPTTSGQPLVDALLISKIDVYQGVQATIAKGGAKATHLAPIIVGREALMRVSVTPESGFASTSVTGVVTIETSSGTKTYSSAATTIGAASTDAALASTINVDLPATAITADAQYSVALYASGPQSGSGSSDGAQYPAGGALEALGATNTGSVMKITIVPVQYGADGSNRVPDTSAAQIELYRQAAFEKYPAQSVVVSVRAPYASSIAIGADGSGFSDLLQAMMDLRQQDGVADDVYYFGAFDGADTFDNYCSGGCVAGLCSVVTDAGDPTGRACVGIGFSGTDSADTMAHEVGHAHGRQHADCGGATGIDPQYPYSGASIGVWGYSLIDKSLKAPTTFTDMMGYCNPTWISDYNFAALAERMAAVTGGKDVLNWASPRPFRFVTVGGDGSLTWGRSTTLRRAPSTTKKTVKLLDASGAQTGTVTGYYWDFDHLPGGQMLVPELSTGVSAISVPGPHGDTVLRTSIASP
ncbi:MAG: hypothetical protein ACHREM_25605 [Polyangiales bacterium]